MYLYPIPQDGLERWPNIYRVDDDLDPVKLPDLSVTPIDFPEATVTESVADELTFELPADLVTGYYWPIVWSGSWGAADYGQLTNAEISLFVPVIIDSVSPSTLPAQGGFVTITGSGFPEDISDITLQGVTFSPASVQENM